MRAWFAAVFVIACHTAPPPQDDVHEYVGGPSAQPLWFAIRVATPFGAHPLASAFDAPSYLPTDGASFWWGEWSDQGRRLHIYMGLGRHTPLSPVYPSSLTQHHALGAVVLPFAAPRMEWRCHPEVASDRSGSGRYCEADSRDVEGQADAWTALDCDLRFDSRSDAARITCTQPVLGGDELVVMLVPVPPSCAELLAPDPVDVDPPGAPVAIHLAERPPDYVGPSCDWTESCVDSDGDGRPDEVDNCPDDPNPGWADQDQDLHGDACDACPADSANWYDPHDTSQCYAE